MPSEWHTYWKNPGDSGQATELRWTLPQGVTAGPALWPVPEKMQAEGLTTYGYSSNVMLLVPLELTTNLRATTLDFKVKVSWLECGTVCLPGSTNLQGRLVYGGSSKPSPDRALVETWRKRLPLLQGTPLTQARWGGRAEGDARPVLITCDAAAPAKSIDFFPYASEGFEVSGESETHRSAAGLELRKTVRRSSTDWPRWLKGLLIIEGAKGAGSAAYDVNLEIGQPPDLK
jgi:thiol:disulfide interchange protein DsbD